MSLKDTNLVSRETAERLQALLAQTPGPRFMQNPARGGARGRMPVIVRCDSATAVGGGGIGDEAFDATMIAAHGTVASASQPDQTPVWLTVWGDGVTAETPTADAVYHGVFAGDFDPDPGGANTDRRPRVFAVAPAAASDSTWKNPARVAATGSVTVSNPGTSTFDGVSLSSGDRVLLPFQTSAVENGLYAFNGSSSAMTRTADADHITEVAGAVVAVLEGTVYADSVWMCTANAVGGAVGSASLPFRFISPVETTAYTTSVGAQIGAGTSGVYGDIVTGALTLTRLGRWQIFLNVNATIHTSGGTTAPASIDVKVIQSSGDSFTMSLRACNREVAGAFAHTESHSVSKILTVTQTTVLKIQAAVTAGTLSGNAADASVNNTEANTLYAVYLGSA